LFAECRSLRLIAFETSSRLERIEGGAFAEIGLTEIAIPASVKVIGEECFQSCEALASVTFDAVSGLERIEKLAFEGT
jgi:hypothetical protein